MEKNNIDIKTDLTIIGAGMAGLAAAVFAANRGISTIITGKRSSMNFATGLMDLMGVYPSGREWDNPWDAIELLRKDIPKHPYSFISNQDIKKSLLEIVDFLKKQQLYYGMKDQNNVNVLTSLGTVKKSYLIPTSMCKGLDALEKKAPCLIVDFAGMKIYSAKQIVSTISNRWQNLQSVRIDFPGMEKLEEVYPEHIARALDIEENRIKLAALIKPIIDKIKFEYIGFPALLGMYKSDEAVKHLEELLNIPIFEIPTPPVSVPGIRLHEALTEGLSKNSDFKYLPEMVKNIEVLEDNTFNIKITKGNIKEIANIKDNLNYNENHNNFHIVNSKAVILATGRFMGKGLTAKRTGIFESLLNLPVTQPKDRKDWHYTELFHPQGHPVNSAGIEIDEKMRPLNSEGKYFAENLFAAGSIIAHSDWTRMKCGSGVAIATAFAAINAAMHWSASLQIDEK